MPPLKICLVASEVTPFAKTGGLADVAAGLARALHDAGHDVRLVMPFYPRVRAKAETIEPATATTTLSLGSREIEVGFARTTLPNSPVPVHLVDCPELFDRDELYGGKDEHDSFRGPVARSAHRLSGLAVEPGCPALQRLAHRVDSAPPESWISPGTGCSRAPARC